MSQDEPLAALSDPRRRILWLAVGHLAVGVSWAFVTWFGGRSPMLQGAVLLGLVFSETSLLGIWGGLGSNPWWQRLLGVLVGIAYLFTLLGLGISELRTATFIVVAVATLSVAAVLLIVRMFRLAIHRDALLSATAGRIQFSVRHLMILTLVIACLITIEKSLYPHVPFGDMLFRLLLFAITGGVVGILPVWFVLATKRPVVWSVGLLVLGGSVGYCVGSFDRLGEWFWASITATEATAVVVSLFVVRCCGYRLVRLPAPVPQAAQ